MNSSTFPVWEISSIILFLMLSVMVFGRDYWKKKSDRRLVIIKDLQEKIQNLEWRVN